jgi:Holliday junction resolvase
VGSRSRNAASVEARGVPETDQLGGKVDRENSLTSESRQPRRGGRGSRDKGGREERNLVNRHLELGIHAERYPLSGASRFRGSGHDIDVYAFGRDEGPLVAESKARKNGGGFVQIESWLAEHDLLFLKRNHADPLVLLPWRIWEQLLKRVRR